MDKMAFLYPLSRISCYCRYFKNRFVWQCSIAISTNLSGRMILICLKYQMNPMQLKGVLITRSNWHIGRMNDNRFDQVH